MNESGRKREEGWREQPTTNYITNQKHPHPTVQHSKPISATTISHLFSFIFLINFNLRSLRPQGENAYDCDKCQEFSGY
jgi:hypothetical protein